MIGSLRGTLKLINDPFIIIEVNGVGYEVIAGSIAALEGATVELFVHTHVREQEITLYGFQEEKSISIFRLLITVSGVGPKSAFLMVNDLGYDQILSAISSDNPKGLKVKGIGSKTSQKIIVELKNRIENMIYEKSSPDEPSSKQELDTDSYVDVMEALSSLGYRKGEIDQALDKIDYTENMSTEKIVKQVLGMLKR